MQASSQVQGDKAVLKLSGRFDFNTHREFRAAYEPVVEKPGITQVVIDLAGVDYLDSSALGMLLMLREKAVKAKRTVVLSGVRGSVEQVLNIARFSELFKIE